MIDSARKLAVAALLCLAPAWACAWAAAEHDSAYYASRTQEFIYKSKAGETLPYRLFVPANYNPKQKYPLVFALHGAGGRGDDNKRHLAAYLAGWIDKDVQDKYPCFILMPQCPADQQWVATPWANGSYDSARIPISKPLTLALEILDKVRKEYSVDPARLYAIGASMGGYGTWDTIQRNPELFAAAVPVCGAGDPKLAGKLTVLPIWTFHGDKDVTVPFSGSKDMADAIQKAGGKLLKFTVYKDVAHESYNLYWKEPGLTDWLFSQIRKNAK